MKNKIILLLTFILGITTSLSADSGWTVNPYDYQYDMTAYVGLEIDGNRIADIGGYEIAAFCDDQCRGILEVKNTSGMQYGYIRIHSNKDADETIKFRVSDKATGMEINCQTSIDFSADSSIGYPSQPFIIRCSFIPNVEIFFSKKLIHITCDFSDATIFYTTDGSEPTMSNGISYNGPFLPDFDCVIKAFAIKDGYNPSSVTSYQYAAEDHTVPRLVLVPHYQDNVVDLVNDSPDIIIPDGETILMSDTAFLNPGDEFRYESFPAEIFNGIASFEWKSEDRLERGPVTLPINFATKPEIDFNGAIVKFSNNLGNNLIVETKYDNGLFDSTEINIESSSSLRPLLTGNIECYAFGDSLFRSDRSSFDIHALRSDDNFSVMLNQSNMIGQAIGNGQAKDWTSLTVVGPVDIAPIGTTDLKTISTLHELQLLDIEKTCPDYGTINGLTDLDKLMGISMPRENADNCNWDFSNNNLLSAIKWNSQTTMPADIWTSVSNRHALLYVKNKSFAPEGVTNLVCDGIADYLTLDNQYPFYVIDAFMAGEAVFTKNFSKATAIDGCAGWETMTVPFDVHTVMDAIGEVYPFAAETGDRRFWLYNSTSTGWERSSEIKAYQPYIIAMPNHPWYEDNMNIRGDIKFSAYNVNISATSATISSPYKYGMEMMSVFMPIKASEEIYVINDNEYEGYAPGSVFVRNLRDVRPFDCCITGTTTAKYLPVMSFSDVGMIAEEAGMKIWMESGNICILSPIDSKVPIYNTLGNIVRIANVKAGEICHIGGLTKGIYLVGQTKLYVK